MIAPKKRSGNSKVFDLVAVVEEQDGEPVRGVEVKFQTRFGNLESTPTGETFPDTDDADLDRNTSEEIDDIGDGTTTTPEAEEGLIVTDITDRLGRAHVIYDLGTNSGRQEIDASIYDEDNSATVKP